MNSQTYAYARDGSKLTLTHDGANAVVDIVGCSDELNEANTIFFFGQPTRRTIPDFGIIHGGASGFGIVYALDGDEIRVVYKSMQPAAGMVLAADNVQYMSVSDSMSVSIDGQVVMQGSRGRIQVQACDKGICVASTSLPGITVEKHGHYAVVLGYRDATSYHGLSNTGTVFLNTKNQVFAYALLSATLSVHELNSQVIDQVTDCMKFCLGNNLIYFLGEQLGCCRTGIHMCPKPVAFGVGIDPQLYDVPPNTCGLSPCVVEPCDEAHPAAVLVSDDSTISSYGHPLPMQQGSIARVSAAIKGTLQALPDDGERILLDWRYVQEAASSGKVTANVIYTVAAFLTSSEFEGDFPLAKKMKDATVTSIKNNISAWKAPHMTALYDGICAAKNGEYKVWEAGVADITQRKVFLYVFELLLNHGATVPLFHKNLGKVSREDMRSMIIFGTTDAIPEDKLTRCTAQVESVRKWAVSVTGDNEAGLDFNTQEGWKSFSRILRKMTPRDLSGYSAEQKGNLLRTVNRLFKNMLGLSMASQTKITETVAEAAAHISTIIGRGEVDVPVPAGAPGGVRGFFGM